MHLGKTLSLLAISSTLFISCKSTSQLSRISSPITYTINNSIQEDSAIVNYYLPYRAKLDAEMNRVIGKSDIFLSKNKNSPETLIGNFFTDAILAIGKTIDPEATIALGTKGGIRTEIKQGDITVGNIFEVMPFENAITLLDLKGTDILTLANYIAKTGGQPISGLTLDIKDDKAVNIKVNNQDLDTTKTYKLVTYDYLANGGDYIEGITKPITRFDTPIRVREALIKYVEDLTKEGKTINTKLDGRVKISK